MRNCFRHSEGRKVTSQGGRGGNFSSEKEEEKIYNESYPPSPLTNTSAATITLSNLPAPTLELGSWAPWDLITSRMLADAIGVDAGLLNVWIWRRLGPEPLPASFFKGRTRVFRVSAALVWLAHRQGECSDEITWWRKFNEEFLGLHFKSNSGERDWVLGWAQKHGLEDARQAGIRFRVGGWNSHLSALGGIIDEHPRFERRKA